MANKLLHLNAITSEFSSRTNPNKALVLIIDCSKDLDTKDLTYTINPVKPTFIVLTNQSSESNVEISEYLTLITDKRGVGPLLEIYRKMNVAVTSIVSDINFNTDVLKTHNNLIKQCKTTLTIVHGQNGTETNKLIELFDFGAKHACTINNQFEQLITKNTNRSLISIFNLNKLRNKPMDNDYSNILKGMAFNAYFDARFNSFGLHSEAELNGTTRKLIVIDHEYLYDVYTFEVIKIEKNEFEIVWKFKNDPFPLLTRQLHRRSYHKKEVAINVSIEDRLFAAHIRNNLKKVFECREQSYIDATKEILKNLSLPITNTNINEYKKLITGGTPNTIISEFDLECFKLLHHSPNKFLRCASKDLNKFFAKDIFNSRLYFELAKSDNYLEILQYFLKCSHPMIFQPVFTDSNGMTLLEIAASFDSPLTIQLLAKHNFNINHVSAFKFTALDRAISNKSTLAIHTLKELGAKTATEVEQA